MGKWADNSVRQKTFTIDNKLPTIKQILAQTIFLSLTLCSFSQVTPMGLKDKTLQTKIIEKTSAYDSLVLFDRSSFWGDDHAVTGFAFKKGDCFKIKMYFDKGKEMYSLKFNRIENNKDKVYDNLKNYIVSKYNILKTLNNDSLNIKSRTNTSMDVSDQSEATITIINSKLQEFIYKNSYAPELYQQYAWTTDRQVLIDVFTRIKEHLK